MTDSNQVTLTAAAVALLATAPRRIPCYSNAYSVALALEDMGLVSVTDREQRGHIVSYLVTSK